MNTVRLILTTHVIESDNILKLKYFKHSMKWMRIMTGKFLKKNSLRYWEEWNNFEIKNSLQACMRQKKFSTMLTLKIIDVFVSSDWHG